ncbi:divergent PAP2 family protein [Halanaerobium hydrogeniformans]|uniref:Acid phosphatase/vanadium-dependent haloperoxidase related protein n=1 Tax=Halanaerobium hydrogeniformans TaxID=656519 RepID=E4RML3_HALHG|nr:divergent PAP2 family protein [Halanaerobium hydrogeniformans]ADQ14544.1 acid phosphatase/vanadium-dependent haloperoxidase related protein [Halanaerobium hydrogeniformans]
MSLLAISILSLFIAQFLKIFFIKPFNFYVFFTSGGMPSSHSSFVSTLAFSVGLKYGFNSDLFAIVAVFAMIVTYDASGVRRAVGQQANVLNNLIRHLEAKAFSDDKEIIKEDLKELIGHTPFEVLAGILLGALIAIINWYIFLL